MGLRIRLASVLALALLLAGCGGGEGAAPQEQAASADSAQALPPLVEAADFDLADYEGQVVLLNFWATWCAPCLAEMPDLVQIQRERGNDGLQIIGVAMDQRGREAVVPYLQRQPTNYPIVLDPRAQVSDDFGGIPVLPTTLMIGPQGEVRQRIRGRMLLEDLQRYVDDALASGGAETEDARGQS